MEYFLVLCVIFGVRFAYTSIAVASMMEAGNSVVGRNQHCIQVDVKNGYNERHPSYAPSCRPVDVQQVTRVDNRRVVAVRLKQVSRQGQNNRY
ncbi:hypothetical protein PF005_g4378 [Phytophthora fragariae]|uniref:Secreted protein n=1 Tax=Phytophthora fragariae TaxID=53985 RepID=A0A6A3ZVJ2_9STRA|nr:hypothetical protein PF003_g16353 [Phytophthora fragariae]KAE8938237.1 hypothetical protein PF009_g11875 [Phytophthora fragariae]KAE9017908.1 hypothetical protein PF011_g6496 [Phytophthora fragariae]KAE9120710.1 hypothetical protein PF007_g8064 [Phytophthora fragariae]KAE9121678.1 hypothetical protein PF010_g7006 [Phytophthora fragariae]